MNILGHCLFMMNCKSIQFCYHIRLKLIKVTWKNSYIYLENCKGMSHLFSILYNMLTDFLFIINLFMCNYVFIVYSKCDECDIQTLIYSRELQRNVSFSQHGLAVSFTPKGTSRTQ